MVPPPVSPLPPDETLTFLFTVNEDTSFLRTPIYNVSVSIQYASSPSSSCISLGFKPTLILFVVIVRLGTSLPSLSIVLSTFALELPSLKNVPGRTSSNLTDVLTSDTSARIWFTASWNCCKFTSFGKGMFFQSSSLTSYQTVSVSIGGCVPFHVDSRPIRNNSFTFSLAVVPSSLTTLEVNVNLSPKTLRTPPLFNGLSTS